MEQGVPSGGWVTGHELSSLEPVQSQESSGRRNNPVERKEGRCFRETLRESVLGSHCPGNLRHWQQMGLPVTVAPFSAGSGTVGAAPCSSSWEKERDCTFHLLLGSQQGQSLISLQVKAAGVELLAGAGAQPCPATFHSSRMSSLQDLSQNSGREVKGAVPSTYLCFLCTPSLSHCPAVLDAALGRNARPGQEAAEEALGLSVNPLGNGARAQAGQCGANVL